MINDDASGCARVLTLFEINLLPGRSLYYSVLSMRRRENRDFHISRPLLALPLSFAVSNNAARMLRSSIILSFFSWDAMRSPYKYRARRCFEINYILNDDCAIVLENLNQLCK